METTPRSEQDYADDRIVKLGTDWVRVSAVEAVEKRPTSEPGSRVWLRGGESITVPGWPDDVIDRLFLDRILSTYEQKGTDRD